MIVLDLFADVKLIWKTPSQFYGTPYICLKFVQLMKDIEELLASDDNFLLGTWLESAKALASNPTDLRQYEWNARTQVIMWYDDAPLLQSKLHDYANKFWSGRLKDYYLPRASTYFYYLLFLEFSFIW